MGCPILREANDGISGMFSSSASYQILLESDFFAREQFCKGSLGALFMLILTAHIREQGRKFPKLYSMTYPAHGVKVVGQVVGGVKHARERLRSNE